TPTSSRSLPQRACSFVRRRWPLLVVPLIIVAGLWVALRRFNSLRVDEPTGYSAASKVEGYTGVPVPAQSVHIKTAGFSKGMIFSHYVRFEAPVEVCLAYAKQVARGAELTPASPDAMDSILAMNRPRFRDLSWFDLPSASD